MVGIVHPGIYHPVHPWVYRHPTCTVLSVHQLPVPLRWVVKEPWAQSERFPWVGASQRLKVRKGVMIGGNSAR